MADVRLLEYTPEPERIVASAARLCYSPVGVTQIQERMSDADVVRFIRDLVGMRHFSPFEHVSFTFGVEGVSRVCLNQLVRHRIASYSQQSQRYVKESQFDYIIPPSLKKNPEAVELFRSQMAQIQETYNRLLEMGIHREDARYVLPGGCESKIVVSMNARALLNFFELRTCTRAQWEIRAVANQMLAQVREVAPVLFKDAGPPCISQGLCYEGKMSCGKILRLERRSLPFVAARVIEDLD